MGNFYITTPIYYVNAKPHIGHAYTSIFADVMKRCHGIFGEETYLLTGTDEHGDKIAKTAAQQGTTAQELIDLNSQRFRQLLPKIGVENDDFIRTTETRHKKVVIDLLQKVYDKGDIYFANYSGKYCVGCERFYGDDELVEGKCPDHNVVPEQITEKNYFFKMSKYWEALKKHLTDNPDFIITSNFKAEVLGLLRQKPQDLCISRPKSRLTWGIELPFDKDFVTYVWFDALINYVSALGYPDHKNYQQFWPSAHHVIGKDILKPHCVYWPMMLMAMELPLPKQVAVHGYWLVDETKMSKSLGNNVDPLDYCKRYSLDVFRYFLIRSMSFGKDSSFSHHEFVRVCNSDLSNNIGNLYSRVVGLCYKNCDHKIPAASKEVAGALELKTSGLALESTLQLCVQKWELHRYAETIMEYANKVNKFLNDTKPWLMAKDVDKKQELGTVLKESLEAIRLIYLWLWPITPIASEKVLAELQLAFASAPQGILTSAQKWDQLTVGAILPKKVTGFARIVKDDVNKS